MDGISYFYNRNGHRQGGGDQHGCYHEEEVLAHGCKLDRLIFDRGVDDLGGLDDRRVSSLCDVRSDIEKIEAPQVRDVEDKAVGGGTSMHLSMPVVALRRSTPSIAPQAHFHHIFTGASTRGTKHYHKRQKATDATKLA